MTQNRKLNTQGGRVVYIYISEVMLNGYVTYR